METTMKTKTVSFAAGILVLALAGPAPAAEQVIDLVAGATTLALPDGASVPAWGFGLTAGTVSVPGPALPVDPGNALRINLTNNLPVPVSIMIPGQAMPEVGGVPSQPVKTGGRITSFVVETAPGATLSYVWPSLKPGTYLYQSGTHIGVQVPMGLYGALKKDAAPGEVYAGETYAQETLLLFSEIDPALNEKVAADVAGGLPPSRTVDNSPKYFLLNGKTFDPGNPVPSVPPGTRTLVRLLNAGLETRAPLFLGTRASVIAEDGSPYVYAKDFYCPSLPAGKTLDAIIGPVAAGRIAILDRRLFLSSGGHGSVPPNGTGGMLTYIQVQ